MPRAFWRQRLEQYLTSAQQRAHFLRQQKGRRQWRQSFSGRGRGMVVEIRLCCRLSGRRAASAELNNIESFFEKPQQDAVGIHIKQQRVILEQV